MFWQRFKTDPAFRQKMRGAWKNQVVHRDQQVQAGRKGAEALWRRYNSDPQFKRTLDQTLQSSRSRGGAKSLLNLGIDDFKKRLAASADAQHWPNYRDNDGNLLRSRLELQVANAFHRSNISYEVEPRLVVSGHAFYPDFRTNDGQVLVEVVGYTGDGYWNGTAKKVRLIIQNYPKIRVALITRFLKQMEWRLKGTPRVAFFTPYELDRLSQWCRGCRGSQEIVPEGRVVNARATRSKAGPQLEINHK